MLKESLNLREESSFRVTGELLSFTSTDFQVSRWQCRWQRLRRRRRCSLMMSQKRIQMGNLKVKRTRSLRNPSTGKGWCSQSKVYRAPPNFKGNESRDPSSVPKSKTETSAQNRRSSPSMRQNLHVKNLDAERSGHCQEVKESRQKTSSWWSANNCNPLISCCYSRTQSFFVSPC